MTATTATPSYRGEWVSYFDERGRARHVPVDSLVGQQVTDARRAAEGEILTCQAPRCTTRFHAGRRDARFCSSTCQRRALRRARS